MGNLLTVKDVQKKLQLGQNRVYELIKLKGFPAIKFGRSYRIPEEELDKWLTEHINTTIYI